MPTNSENPSDAWVILIPWFRLSLAGSGSSFIRTIIRRHVHGFSGGVEAIIDLRDDETVALANRERAVRPANAKRSDVRKILRAAAERFEELAAAWEEIHGDSNTRA